MGRGRRFWENGQENFRSESPSKHVKAAMAQKEVSMRNACQHSERIEHVSGQKVTVTCLSCKAMVQQNFRMTKADQETWRVFYMHEPQGGKIYDHDPRGITKSQIRKESLQKESIRGERLGITFLDEWYQGLDPDRDKPEQGTPVFRDFRRETYTPFRLGELLTQFDRLNREMAGLVEYLDGRGDDDVHQLAKLVADLVYRAQEHKRFGAPALEYASIADATYLIALLIDKLRKSAQKIEKVPKKPEHPYPDLLAAFKKEWSALPEEQTNIAGLVAGHLCHA